MNLADDSVRRRRYAEPAVFGRTNRKCVNGQFGVGEELPRGSILAISVDDRDNEQLHGNINITLGSDQFQLLIPGYG